MGSSPRMRGTHRRTTRTCRDVGIIPAYAGNTFREQFAGNEAGDHPRVCGEHTYSNIEQSWIEGSSPRMRGTLLCGYRGDGWRGIIPAYAGNTMREASPNRGNRDHPRVCGEHCPKKQLRRVVSGSSPRMRGTHKHAEIDLPTSGIIPAYAGNTARSTTCTKTDRDHPRVCGEHGVETDGDTVMRGSSPRMRGTHDR